MTFIIHRKPPYRVFVEEGPGGAVAHVAELPGCFAVGSDASRAVAGTPKAIVAFLAWLRKHREPLVPEALVSRPSMADLYVAEVISESAPDRAGSRAAIFEFDRAAWNDDKLDRTLRWLSYSHADLLSAIEGMDEASLKSIRLSPNRTLWDTLGHIADADYGYARCIASSFEGIEPVTPAGPAGVRDRLSTMRKLLEKTARSIPAAKRAETIYPTWANHADDADEPWTVQKALRIALEHERKHLHEIMNRV